MTNVKPRTEGIYLWVPHEGGSTEQGKSKPYVRVLHGSFAERSRDIRGNPKTLAGRRVS